MEEHVPVLNLNEVMVDLCARFVINNPSNEYTDPMRFLFLLELAHWYYMDNWIKRLPYLPMIVDFKVFVVTFVKEVRWSGFDLRNVDSEIDKWKVYKSRIPVVGALLLNEAMTHVIRVKSPYSSHYSFPRGKMNKQEDPRFSCMREIKEETGVQLTLEQCKPEFSFTVESKQRTSNHQTTYYVVPAIPMDVEFKPMCKEEIGDVKWDPIEKIETRDPEKEKLLEIIEKIKKSN
ncbi:mRNA-decapping enzyme, putative [Entamoeba invadens IP1]|uniref:mRNA-decapping enzyme, putative n=1 Tax=Entamoeba invadens IP1 TaxID=370355 RepID=UPI0002C3EDF5|nr:mRNA-decapping enzyme, putative [Entamoeba invadens IP1]ELP93147.1 mRNA-decapping enzyme, putative [Entamoeba invadens IP1]|eukprot:XP_004259918.1 mRNA-decapping enzyme, putative [Entamoeba invadens IP1]